MIKYTPKQYIKIMEEDFQKYIDNQYKFHFYLWKSQGLDLDMDTKLNHAIFIIFSEYDFTIIKEDHNHVVIQYRSEFNEKYTIDFQLQKDHKLVSKCYFVAEENANFQLSVYCNSNKDIMLAIQEIRYLLEQYEHRVAEPFRIFIKYIQKDNCFDKTKISSPIKIFEELQEKTDSFEQRIPIPSWDIMVSNDILQQENSKGHKFILPYMDLSSEDPVTNLATAISTVWGSKAKIVSDSNHEINVNFNGIMAGYSCNFYFPDDEMIVSCFCEISILGEMYSIQFQYECRLNRNIDMIRIVENVNFLLDEFRRTVILPFENKIAGYHS